MDIVKSVVSSLGAQEDPANNHKLYIIDRIIENNESPLAAMHLLATMIPPATIPHIRKMSFLDEPTNATVVCLLFHYVGVLSIFYEAQELELRIVSLFMLPEETILSYFEKCVKAVSDATPGEPIKEIVDLLPKLELEMSCASSREVPGKGSFINIPKVCVKYMNDLEPEQVDAILANYHMLLM
jgi:hypothetical protein